MVPWLWLINWSIWQARHVGKVVVQNSMEHVGPKEPCNILITGVHLWLTLCISVPYAMPPHTFHSISLNGPVLATVLQFHRPIVQRLTVVNGLLYGRRWYGEPGISRCTVAD